MVSLLSLSALGMAAHLGKWMFLFFSFIGVFKKQWKISCSEKFRHIHISSYIIFGWYLNYTIYIDIYIYHIYIYIPHDLPILCYCCPWFGNQHMFSTRRQLRQPRQPCWRWDTRQGRAEAPFELWCGERNGEVLFYEDMVNTWWRHGEDIVNINIKIYL